MVLVLPAPMFGLGFIAVEGGLLALLDGIVRGLRRLARDKHKLTYRANNIDDVTLERGAWWTQQGDSGIARVAMENREADQLGLQVGDRLTFAIPPKKQPLDIAYS